MHGLGGAQELTDGAHRFPAAERRRSGLRRRPVRRRRGARLPDPTVLAPLLAPYGGSTEIDSHRRAHYAAMAVKSQLDDGEHDSHAYDEAYVRAVGVDDDVVALAAGVLGECRVPALWRWPIPESVHGLRLLHDRGIPLGVVSNASGQIADTLCRGGICQIGEGAGVIVRCVVNSHLVGVAKPDPAIFEHAARESGGINGRGLSTSATQCP